MIVCPACGRPTEVGWTTCLNCGKALTPSRVTPGQTLPGREMPQAPAQPQYQQQPQQQYQQQHQQQPYQQQPYQQHPYQRPRNSCFGRCILWLILAFVLWWLVTHFIPAMADLHLLFEQDYTTPREVGEWFSRLIP